jgi:hypothetical protein
VTSAGSLRVVYAEHEAVWTDYALLDASTLAHVKNPGFASRPGRDADGLDPPPSRGLRGTDVQTADHDKVGLRVKLAAVFQRHRHFGKVRDAEEFVV